MLLVPGFSDCSRAEYDVDKGRLVAIRNVLECANLRLEGVFLSLICPLGWFENLDGEHPRQIDEILYLHVQR